jgi:hypothetical protein
MFTILVSSYSISCTSRFYIVQRIANDKHKYKVLSIPYKVCDNADPPAK